MASTTLMTFLFGAPQQVAKVELLGSWDNFTKPYPMQRDKSVGYWHWKGCHSFTGIICDGNVLKKEATKRDGALKMGGTYWYYYRLDDYLELHNPKEPSTNSCPLLPGQTVNLLDVPLQQGSETSDDASTTSSLEPPFTLNPEDKFVAPKPRSPPGRTCKPRTTTALGSTVSKVSRWAKTLLDSSHPLPIGCSKYFTGRPCWTALPQKKLLSDVASVPSRLQTADAVASTCSALSQARSVCIASDVSQSTVALIKGPAVEDYETWNHLPPNHSSREIIEKSSEDSKDTLLAVREGGSMPLDTAFVLDLGAPLYDESIKEQLSFPSDTGAEGNSQTQSRAVSSHKLQGDTTVSYSNRTSGAFSLLSDSLTGFTNHASPQQSQPRTPSMSEFGDFVLDALRLESVPPEDFHTKVDDGHPLGFGGYNLSDEQHASTLTLRPAEASPGLKRLQNSSSLSPKKSKAMVETWNDGREQPQSSLQELIDDLGYLSSMID